MRERLYLQCEACSLTLEYRDIELAIQAGCQHKKHYPGHAIAISSSSLDLHMLNMEFIAKLDRFLHTCPGSITSLYRTRKRNLLVGGAPNSFHCLGEAADVIYDDLDLLKSAASKAIEFFHGVEVDLRNLHLHVDNRQVPWLVCVDTNGKSTPLHRWLGMTV